MTNGRGIKKGTTFVPAGPRAALNKLSKAALMDIAWNLAALGTDESEAAVFAHLANEAVIVCEAREDAVPAAVKEAAGGSLLWPPAVWPGSATPHPNRFARR